jgi:hypothetical protein
MKEAIKLDIEGFEPTEENMKSLLNREGKYDPVPSDLKYGYGPFEINGYILSTEAEYGGEGQGEDYWVVVRVEKDGISTYWKYDGWYASYDGGYLENVYKVEPKQKMVTVYE